MQTDDILILADNDFTSIKKDVIRSTKIMIKDKKLFTPIYFLKFNSAQIKFDSNRIVITKKSPVKKIPPVINHVVDSTSSKEITRKKLSLKKQYLAQKTKDAYIASMY